MRDHHIQFKVNNRISTIRILDLELMMLKLTRQRIRYRMWLLETKEE